MLLFAHLCLNQGSILAFCAFSCVCSAQTTDSILATCSTLEPHNYVLAFCKLDRSFLPSASFLFCFFFVGKIKIIKSSVSVSSLGPVVREVF